MARNLNPPNDDPLSLPQKPEEDGRKSWSKTVSFGFLESDVATKLSGTDWRVLIALMNKAKGGKFSSDSQKDELSFTSRELTYFANVSARHTVDLSLQKLKNLGIIDWEASTSRGYNGVRKIIVNFPLLFQVGIGDDNRFTIPKTEKAAEIQPRPPLIPRKPLTEEEREREKREYLQELYSREDENGENVFGSKTPPPPKKYPEWF